MFLKILILSIILLSFAIVGLSVQILFSKKKKFPEIKISRNKEMRKRKIYCGGTLQKIIDNDLKRQKVEDCDGCS